MQENGGRQQGADYVPPVHYFVESVELAGVVEAGGDERREAKDEKVEAFGGTGTPIIDKKADSQVEEANRELIVIGTVARGGLNDDVSLPEFDAVASEGVVGGTKNSDLPKGLRDIQRFGNRVVLNFNELIADMNPGVVAGPVLSKVGGDHDGLPVAIGFVDPGDSIVRNLVIVEVLETQDCADDCCHRKD